MAVLVLGLVVASWGFARGPESPIHDFSPDEKRAKLEGNRPAVPALPLVTVDREIPEVGKSDESPIDPIDEPCESPAGSCPPFALPAREPFCAESYVGPTVRYEARVIGSTPLAICVRLGDRSRGFLDFEMAWRWIPKSVICPGTTVVETADEGILILADWWIKAHGWPGSGIDF
jgi:hypothetical protein